MMKSRTGQRWLVSLGIALLVAALGLVGVQVILAQGYAGNRVGMLQADPAAPDVANVQIAHLAPFAADPNTAVTVTVDGFPALSDVSYGDSTGYTGIPAGSRIVRLYVGNDTTPSLTQTIFLTNTVDFTVIAVGGGNGWPLKLIRLVDDNTPPAAGHAKVRIGHLAPFAAAITDTLADVRLQDGTVLLGFDDVPYDTIAGYIELPADEYDLKITNADGSVTLIDPMPVTLTDGQILSVFATGDTQNQPVGVYALPSGASGFFVDRAANVQLAHLAPFDMDPGTAVTVTINGTDVLTNVEFADSSGYLPIPEGDTQVQIYPGASGSPAISVTVPLVHAMNYTALAIGDGANQPLTLTLLMDDLTTPAMGNARIRIGHLAPFSNTLPATAAEIRQQGGPLVLPTAVTYGAISPFVELPAMAYDLKVTAPGGYPALIDPMPLVPVGGDILSVFAVGNGPDKQPLGIFLLPAGQPGALVDLAANVQIAHLAPFAMDPTPGTAVDIKVNGTTVLTDVRFADSTGYLPVKAGTTLVEILPSGTTTVAISTTGYLTHAVNFTALAVGDGTNQPLDLLVLVDDNTPPTSGSAKVRMGHLAPFASVITDTNADIRLQSGPLVIGPVPYGAIAPYTELVSNTYDLKITAPGGAPTLIDPFPISLQDGDILSVFAVGEGSNQPLGIFALPSGMPGQLLPVVRATLYMPIITKMVAP